MTKNYRYHDIIHTIDIVFDLNIIIKNYSSIYLLTDTNCFEKCLPKVKDALSEQIHIYIIEAGEKNKSFETLQLIWSFLIEEHANRNSLLINLGGGVVTDIGGFAASTFKRGIDFINIPTTLLAQVDASAGGKTGINFNGLKNEIGIINQANKVLISPIFLETLGDDEFLSGFAEMLKHSLIYDREYFEELKSFFYFDFKKKDFSKISELIKSSVLIKEHFVKNDINDKGIRQTLNFGHTFGHAFESLINESDKSNIKHGEAVAYGIVYELHLSVKKVNFPEIDLIEISKLIFDIFGEFSIEKKEHKNIYNLMLHDKKNTYKEINCILLKNIGTPLISNKISEHEIFDTLKTVSI